MLEKPIIISGAGPVGLTAAILLSQQGIPVEVLERGDGPSKEWRASTFHAGTLELLEESGLTKELMEHGIIADKVQYRDRKTGVFAEFDFNLIKDETKYPFRLQCPQSTYVQLAYEKLKKSSIVNIHFNSELVSFDQNASGVTVKVNTSHGFEEMHTPFLLAADGARSTIRKGLNLSFDGYTLEEKFLLVGTTKPFDTYMPDIGYVNYVSDPDQFLFILRVPNAWRLLYPVPLSMTDEEAIRNEAVQKQLQTVFDTSDSFPIIETNLYRVHQRIADTFYKGRVVLMGDAGHINSPMGGLGLNSGIHDAVDLSKRLIRVLKNGDISILEKEFQMYSNLRRKVAIEYVKRITETNTRILKEKDSEFREQIQLDMYETANDIKRAREWILNSSLITSIREQGIGN